MTTPIDLSLLPPPRIIDELTYEQILSERKAALLSITPDEERAELAETLAMESEPLTRLLQESAYRELMLRQSINDAARRIMLAYAGGAALDHLGVNFRDAERLPEEADSAYRRRIQLSPEGYSTAGPSEAYRYHALSAHPDVKDAIASSPSPGAVDVVILSKLARGSAPPALVSAVLGVLSDESVRPLTDLVTVRSAEVVTYRIEAALIIGEGPDAAVLRDAAVAESELLATARHGLGRSVPLSAIYAALHRPGVEEVRLTHPVEDIDCADSQAPYCTGINVKIQREGQS